MMGDLQNRGKPRFWFPLFAPSRYTEKMPEPTELILALDVETQADGLAMLKRVGPDLKWVKLGLQLFTRHGPDIVKAVADMGYKVFLDLKLHDIPNTVASAVKSLKGVPCDLLTLHTCGGGEMMRWAVEAAAQTNPNLKLLGVTVLTSMDEAALRETGVEATPAVQVARLAKLGLGCGLQGLVCSPLELPALRETFGPKPLLVTPGVRPLGSAADEQKRVMTPAQAARLGASHIVVGRPILKAPDPAAAVRAIRAELSGN